MGELTRLRRIVEDLPSADRLMLELLGERLGVARPNSHGSLEAHFQGENLAKVYLKRGPIGASELEVVTF